MNETINVVKTVLGFPNEKTSFKKFLVDNRDVEFDDEKDYHFKLFE